MIEVKGDDIIAATLDGKPLFPVSVLEGKTVTIAEPKDGYTPENRTRWLAQSFETSIKAKMTKGFVWSYITGACSNNELRMHHEPMRRRRGNSRKVAWKVLKVIRTGRGVMVRKIRRRRKWSR
jgi:hypothetical protein